MIACLRPGQPFPPVSAAKQSPNGLLAIGADLSAASLLAAYRQGIFPWYGEGQPILWWSPDPRMILRPGDFHVSRSLRKRLHRADYQITSDRDFRAVIAACAGTPRAGQDGTWITPEMRAAYIHLHELGFAHSVECWQDEKLVGGVYGVAMGTIFFAESMFSLASDASKLALAHLARALKTLKYQFIDCQMHTDHLASLGACEIKRSEFAATLQAHCADGRAGQWPQDRQEIWSDGWSDEHRH